jgi:N-acetylneuraminic acid mutarotase
MKVFSILTASLLVTFSASASYDVWNQKANFGGSARHRCTSFSIGTKGYLGLGHINAFIDVEYEDFWEYDPSTNSWTQKADFGGGKRYHAIGFSVGNKAYVGTGREPDGDYTSDLWEFDPVANTWTPKTGMPGPKRRGAACFVIDGIAYVGSGEIQGAGSSNSFYAYNVELDTWSAVAMFPGTQRTSSVSFSIGDKGFFGTGGMVAGSVDFWEYKPTTDQWIQRANVGTAPRMEAAGFSVNGKGYIGTGDDFSGGTDYADFWEYDPTTNTWIQIEDFGGIPRRYLSCFVIGSKVYAGTGTNGTNFRDFWEFDQLLSVKNTEQIAAISVYPNPVAAQVNMDFKAYDYTDHVVTLYDVAGQLVYSARVINQQTVIERNGLPAGNYFYTIASPDRVIKSGQLIFE